MKNRYSLPLFLLSCLTFSSFASNTWKLQNVEYRVDTLSHIVIGLSLIHILITNLLTGSSSTSERAELAKWMNSEDAERNSREAWESASEDIDESLKSEIWNNIQLKIKGAVSSKPVRCV